MKAFACGDVIPGCGARFTGADEDGIFAQVAGHAAADHGVTDITPELVAGGPRPHRLRVRKRTPSPSSLASSRRASGRGL